MKELTIDPEFSTLCPRISAEEAGNLAESLMSDGCREPLVYWKNEGKRLLVDGHSRLELCTKLNIEYPVKERKFTDREQVKVWIILNNLNRRNLNDIQKAEVRAALYALRSPQAEPESDVKVLSTVPEKRHNIAQQVADETGTTERQVHRDVAWVRALNRLAVKSPAIREAAASAAIARKDAMLLADAPQEVVKSIEEMSPSTWRGAAHAAAEALRRHKPPSMANRPVIRCKALGELERSLGKVARLKTEVFEYAGGKRHDYAVVFEQTVRDCTTKSLDAVYTLAKILEERDNRAA